MAHDDNIAVFGIFPTRQQAETCLNVLTSVNFRREDVSVLMSSPDTSKELATEKNTKAPEGVATGATTGGVIGGTIGLLAGVGALAIPGFGPLIAAGPIMATLAGMGVGAATGGVVGALIGVGIPEYEAKRYEGRVKKGGILMSVHCDDDTWAERAEKILEQNGAEDISSAGETSVRKAS